MFYHNTNFKGGSVFRGRVNQKITNKRDGSIVLELNTSGWDDVKRWVLSYGYQAKVLKPEKLRKEIIAEYSKSFNQYK